jgi:hypothetical protein
MVIAKKITCEYITEHNLQVSIFDYVNKILPALRPFIFAIPNGGHRHIAVARNLRDEGVTPGVWDMFIGIPNLIKHGLFIECKVKNNTLSNFQAKFKEKLEKLSYSFSVCKSIEDFEETLKDYFGLEKLNNKEILSRLGCEEFIQKNSKFND